MCCFRAEESKELQFTVDFPEPCGREETMIRIFPEEISEKGSHLGQLLQKR